MKFSKNKISGHFGLTIRVRMTKCSECMCICMCTWGGRCTDLFSSMICDSPMASRTARSPPLALVSRIELREMPYLRHKKHQH